LLLCPFDRVDGYDEIYDVKIAKLKIAQSIADFIPIGG